MDDKQINFQETLKQIEEIVSSIESGELSLDESLKRYEECKALIKKVNEALEEAEQKVSLIVKEIK